MSSYENLRPCPARGRDRARKARGTKGKPKGIQGMAKVEPIVNPPERDGLCYRVGCGVVATVVYVETIKKGKARLTRTDWCDVHAEEYPQPKRLARCVVRL